MTQVRMHHPALEKESGTAREMDVHSDSVHVYERSGWVRVKETKKGASGADTSA